MDLKEYIQKQKEKAREMPEKQYAIGEHIISQEQFNFIKGCFAENVLPPDFTIHRKTWGNGMPELPGIPDRPMPNCDVIKYKDTIFAEFTGYWEFAQESKVNGIPPITEKDLSHIGTRATLSNDRQMLQWERWHQPDNLSDFGISVEPEYEKKPIVGTEMYINDSKESDHLVIIPKADEESLDALLDAIESDVRTIDGNDEPIKDEEEIGC